jgi:hypothetical protein
MGATALWLSPITNATRGDFGYAVNDYFAIRRDRRFHQAEGAGAGGARSRDQGDS